MVHGSGFRVLGSGLARGACCPLIGDESFAHQLEVRSEELGVRSAGAAHKNQKRREVYMGRCLKVVFKSPVTSYQSLAPPNP